MKVTVSPACPELGKFPHWEEIEGEIERADFGRECAIDADDWTENIVFQLVRNNGMKAYPVVFTYHIFGNMSPVQVVEALREVA